MTELGSVITAQQLQVPFGGQEGEESKPMLSTLCLPGIMLDATGTFSPLASQQLQSSQSKRLKLRKGHRIHPESHAASESEPKLKSLWSSFTSKPT